MKRREFLHRTACAAGAAWIRPSAFVPYSATLPALPRKFSASDTVTLGKTGIQTSRLAMGTGTVGSGHHSHQPPSASKAFPTCSSMATTTACAFSIPPTPTAATRTSPKR